MLSTFSGLKIKAIASALPKQRIAVDSFIPRFGEETVKRFKEAVGIETLPHAAPHQTAADLACEAVKALRDAGRFDPTSIDVLLFVSQTPDAIAPSTSSQLQQRLGLPEAILALDINQGCAGFLVGLLTAAHFFGNPRIRNVLLLGGDTLTRHINPEDPTSAMLFGDAGFATVIGRDDAEIASTWSFAASNAASKAITIPYGAPFRMEGTEVFNFTITRIPEQIQHLLAYAQTSTAELDLLILHQANAFIVRQIARMFRVSMEKVPLKMTHRGNTSGASIPLLLTDLAAAGENGSKHIALSAFGVGLTWVSAIMTLDFTNILPTVELTHD